MTQPPPTSAALKIRPATPADREAVAAVLTASYGELFAGWYAPELLTAILPFITTPHDDLLASGTYFLVTDERGSPVAVGGWTHATPPARDTGGGSHGPSDTFVEDHPAHGHIRHFATHPAHLRRGAARMILEACETEARGAGLTALVCRSSLPGEPFYAAFGFEPVRRIETRLQNGCVMASILMVKPLA